MKTLPPAEREAKIKELRERFIERRKAMTIEERQAKRQEIKGRLDGIAEPALGTTGQGPDAATRAHTGSLVIAEAHDRAGRRLSQVRLGARTATR